MIHRYSPRVLWTRLKVIASLAGLLLFLFSCEQNPAFPFIPGQAWSFETITIDNLAVTPLHKAPSHGTSLTLYTGPIADPEPREAGILIKFAGLETTKLKNIEAARLVLFRRTFIDSTADPAVSFDFYIVEAQDTAWTEADTGLTIDDFAQRTFFATAQLSEDSVYVYGADSVDIAYPEHLEIPIDTLLLRQWSTGLLANNGFLVLVNGGDQLVSFHSRNAVLSPYLALDLHETTSAGDDTIVTEFHLVSADMSIYPVPVQDLPSDPIQLNHSKGLGGLIDSLAIAPSRPIAGGRLILHTHADSPPLAADQMNINLLWRTDSADEGDIMASTVFQDGSDSLVMNLGAVLLDYVNDLDFYGLELIVNPQYHDFDQLSFWGSEAADSLRPRLEIIYSVPYGQVGE